MEKVAIVTDTNCGLRPEEAAGMGIHLIPMPVILDGKTYFEYVSISPEEFFDGLKNGAQVSTSQPAPGTLLDCWEALLQVYEEIVYIPMSSGLSASCDTATALAAEYDGKVQVVNNQRISVTQKQSVLDALKLAKEGKDAAEIKEILEAEKMEASIYLMVESLKYLKKGGRITPAAAALGTILNLKPVLQIQGEKLDAYAKARGKNKAKKIMLDALKKDLETRFKEQAALGNVELAAAYAGNPEEAEEWKEEIKAAFPDLKFATIDPVSLSIACHVGPGVLAVTCQKVL